MPPETRAAAAPMLVVPGAFSDTDSFERLAAFFRDRGRRVEVVRPPARESSVPQLTGGGLEAFDAAIDEVCDGTPEPPVVMGHSIGGLAVQRLARRRELAAAVLLTPVPPWGLGGDMLRLLRSSPADALKMGMISLSAWPIRSFSGPLGRRFGFRPPNGLMSEDADEETIASSSRRRASESWRLLAEAAVGGRGEVEPLPVPTLLVAGTQDSIVPARTVRALAGRLEGEYLEFDVAHAFAEEPGLAKVLDPVDDWLRSH